MGKLTGLLTLTTIAVALGTSLGFAKPAQAELAVCNRSKHVAYIALGYNLGEDRWRSQGWWELQKGECKTVLDGDLAADSFYYLYAANKDESWIWEGNNKKDWFCVKPNEDFQLTFIGENCAGAGTDKRVFWEIKVQGASHMENLVD